MILKEGGGGKYFNGCEDGEVGLRGREKYLNVCEILEWDSGLCKPVQSEQPLWGLLCGR